MFLPQALFYLPACSINLPVDDLHSHYDFEFVDAFIFSMKSSTPKHAVCYLYFFIIVRTLKMSILLTRFEMYRTVSWMIGTMLYNRSLELMYFAQLKLYAYWRTITISLSPQPLATTILVSDSVNLTMLDTTYKWNHTAFVLQGGLLHLA